MADDFPHKQLPVIPKDDEREQALMLCIDRRTVSIFFVKVIENCAVSAARSFRQGHLVFEGRCG